MQVLDSMIFGAGSRWTEETTEIVKDAARRAAEELRAARGREGSPFAPDAEIFVINIRLRDLQDEELRKTLLQVPTAFEILPEHSRQLQEAGREVLRASPEFQRLRRSLGPRFRRPSCCPTPAEEGTMISREVAASCTGAASSWRPTRSSA